MKKILFAVCIMLSVLTLTQTAEARSGGSPSDVTSVPASQIPHSVLMQFRSSYPGATNVQWEILPPAYYGTTIYRAKFKFNGSKMKVNFL